jgi:hypothetical protein
LQPSRGSDGKYGSMLWKKGLEAWRTVIAVADRSSGIGGRAMMGRQRRQQLIHRLSLI